MKVRSTFLLILLIFLSLNIVHGQEEAPVNMLANGDFEGEFVELEGAEPREVAEGWAPWHVPASDTSPSFANHDPNYDQETDRIRLEEEGSAQRFFTLFATHQAGVYQEVDSATSGTTYRFSVYAYVWSSSFEDADLSEDPGDVVVRVGIDPNGGTDGGSEDIIWSTAATFFYDAYRQYAVIATAESSTITVFVESTVGEPRANNYIYLDDAVLEVASESVADIDSTPTQETNAVISDETGTPTVTATASATPTATVSGAAQGDAATPIESGGGQASPTSATAATTTSSPTPTAIQTGTPAGSETPISEDFPDTVVHTVVAGDTVSALALEYDSTVAAINSANGLNASNVIYIGQRLIIPINLPVGQAQLAAVAPTETPTPTSTNTPTETPTMTPTFTLTPSPTPTPITYQVLPGDTLERIAQLYGTSVELLALQNGIFNVHQIDVGQILVIPTPVPPTPTPTPIPTATPTPDPATLTTSTYVVQVGDTLGEIAAQFNTTIEAIAQLNGIANPSRIFPGQELQIPGADAGSAADDNADATPTDIPTPTPLPTTVPVTHVVQFGDTLYAIAAQYGVSVVELAQRNGITNYDQLSIGQVLYIPG